MRKHTPGPWFARKRGNDFYYVGVVGVGWNIADTCVADMGGGANDEANAHLIAAAPDLVAALETAAGHLMNAQIDLETGATKQAAIRTIETGLKVVRAAIKKAAIKKAAS